jgi:TPR repeat protein
MSGRGSGGAVKRKRGQQVEEEDAPASMHVTAHPKLLTLQAVVKSSQDTLVLLRLCDVRGAALFSFVQTPPCICRPFAGAAVYDMSLMTHAERLLVVGCGLKGKLVRLLSLGVGRHFEPQRNWHACHMLMQSIVRRVAAGLAAAVRDQVAKEAGELCASGQCAAAVVALQLAIDFGDSNSRALMAWLLIWGREGVAVDRLRAFELAEEGARLGCHHCQGVLAMCYLFDRECEEDYARSLELARESSGKGSRYGLNALGWLHSLGRGGLARDEALAFAFFQLAAAQDLDAAQCCVGQRCDGPDLVESLRWNLLAAAQGCSNAATMLSCDKLMTPDRFILCSLLVSGGAQPAANHRNYTRTTTLPSLAPVNSDANAARA